mmetsp:Transcript_18308/g.57281  ORF Transcript_18308/g.57281 Transcript_18308/m.57281 type:complete len:242 (+) Transcript_18308:177-902(+)
MPSKLCALPRPRQSSRTFALDPLHRLRHVVRHDLVLRPRHVEHLRHRRDVVHERIWLAWPPAGQQSAEALVGAERLAPLAPARVLLESPLAIEVRRQRGGDAGGERAADAGYASEEGVRHGERRSADFRDGPALLGEPANALADEGGGAPVARHVEEESGREGRAVVALQHRGREGHDLRHHGPQRELARKHQHKGASRRGAQSGGGQLVESVAVAELGEGAQHTRPVHLELPAAAHLAVG